MKKIIKSKYGNKKKVVDGIKFDSIDESEYYLYLKRRGLTFTMQNRYTILDKFSYMGRLVRPIVYKDDFRVGNYIIDIKGKETDHFKLKCKWMKHMCNEWSKKDPHNRIYYLVLYDLDHKKYVLKNMPYDIRYMDIQMINELGKLIAKVPKGKGAVARKEEVAKKFIEDKMSLSNTICNVTLSAFYYQ